MADDPFDGLIPSVLENYKTTQEWARVRYGDAEKHPYNDGGYIGPATPPVAIRLHPDECFISATDARAGRLVCSRAGHPTATSDCRHD